MSTQRSPIAPALVVALLAIAGGCDGPSGPAPDAVPDANATARSVTGFLNSPIAVHYTKTETGGGTAVWTGSVSGDVVAGPLATRVVAATASGPILHIETLWVAGVGPRAFEASLRGTLNSSTGALVLNGEITSGFRSAAKVTNRGRLTAVDPVTGATTFDGTLWILQGSRD